MKKVCKSFLLFVVMIFSISTLVFAGFTDTADAKETVSFQYDYDEIQSNMESIAQYFGGMTDVELEYYIENYVGMNKAAFESYKAVKDKDIGKYVSVEKCNIKEHKNDIVADIVVHFENEDVKLTSKFQYISQNVIPVSIEFAISEDDKDVSMGAKMGKAGLNTVMGMGTVFIVLIFLSLVISLFIFIPMIQNKIAAKKEKKTEISVETKDSVVTEEEEELVDDFELVAVITAAIAATQDGQTEGFVVRSIKRSPQNKWKNA